MAGPTVQWQFGNFFETELVVGLTAAGTMVQVPPSATLQLPVCDPGVPSQAQLTIWDGVLPPEIVTCTANPQTGILTVLRAQEGTTAQAWAAGTQIRSALTSQIINAALQAYFDFTTVLAANFLKLTGGTLTGPLLLAADPTLALGAATKQYVDNVQGNKLPISGGTMQGTINMNNNRIVTLPAPVAVTEPVRVQEMNAEVAARVAVAGDNSGKLIAGGGPGAYNLATNSGYTSLVDGTSLRVRFPVTNSRGATLAVDTASAAPIMSSSTAPVPAGLLLPGMPYGLTYSQAAGGWLLLDFYQNGPTTGDVKFTLKTVADPGWLMCDDGSIGNTGSGATHADPSTQDLFIVLWNATASAPANAPVSGGRGSTASADWIANKNITLTKMLGRTLAIAGTGTGLSARAVGDAMGEEAHALAVNELAQHHHGIFLHDYGHTHKFGYGLHSVGSTGANQLDSTNVTNDQNTSGPASTAGPAVGVSGNNVGLTLQSAQDIGGAVQGTINQTADTPSTTGLGHNTMQPTSFLNAMIKL